MFWTEKSECFKLVRLKPEHLATFQMSYWTSPPESDVGVLMSQLKAVMSGEISASSSPFLYQVAKTHLKELLTSEQHFKDPDLLKFKIFLSQEVEKVSSLNFLFNGE